MKIALLLIGFGNVARRFVTLVEESSADLDALGIEPIIVGITTKRHGSVFEAAGLDAVRAAQRIVEGRARGPALAPPTLEFVTRLRSQGVETRIVVETTPLDIRFAEPALTHVRAAFAAGAHVVTANKGPVAFAYRSLAREAAEAGVSFLFEGAVLDGVPIFSLVRETMPACRIRGFRGVVNSTTNFLLTALERRESFDAAVERMQAEGIAEADPSLDVDGWDAAAKTAALANVWLDAGITPHDVAREGVTPAAGERARAALAAGRRLKLVAAAVRDETGVRARVSLEELPADDPLATVDGQGNAIEIDTWPLGRLVITQRDGGLEKTAYALLSDMITVARRVRAGGGAVGAGDAAGQPR